MAARPAPDPIQITVNGAVTGAVTGSTSVLARQISETARLTQPTQCPTCQHREARILARETEQRAVRRRWFWNVFVFTLLVVLGAFAWVRFGSDPMAMTR